MKQHMFLVLAMLSAVLYAAASNAVRNGNYVTFAVEQPQANAPKWVRLQVVSDKIIRVEATADNVFPQKQSLIIVPQAQPYVPFTVTEDALGATIATRYVRAHVDKRTGRVAFYDAQGHVLTAESASLGKQLWPFRVPDRELGQGVPVTETQRRGYSWLLRMDCKPGEALYGLGQHQNNDLNMRGKDEELYQYNTKVSVPFVVSNRGYGVLWDSYSYCRFGHAKGYEPLNRVFRLYDRQGREGALTGTYTDRQGRCVERREDSLCYEVSLPAPARRLCAEGDVSHLPQGFSLNGSRVSYEGYIEAPVSGYYVLNLYYAGYTSLWIGGKEMVKEHWRQAWNPNNCRFRVHLKGGERTPLRIEWRPDGDVSYCALRAAKPQTAQEQGQLTVWSEMARDIDYYLIAGNSIDDVISGYRTLTGKAPVMPKWAMGFWQSRERYKTSADIENTLGEFRKRHIPIDNIVQDWNYWPENAWGDHQFEHSRYPNPQAMLDSVHALHGRFMISVWPKFYATTHHYKELDSRGWMYHQAVADSIRDWVGPGYVGSFYDAYAPGARKLFWKQMDDSLYTRYHQGIDAWWMDASEPNVRDCTPMWYRKALCGPTALGTSTEFFNAYSIMNAEAIYDGQRAVNPLRRVFLLTRSGFAGEQRYSTATWSGDIGTRWEDMRAQMTAGLNFSLSGIPFWGMDIGGFSVENRYIKAQQLYDRTGQENADLKEWRELQARWNQFGCFVPLYRTHGQWPLREVWNISPEGTPTYESIVWYDRLRYRLMPYLYSMAGWAHFNDYTLMRALVMDFNGDSRVYDIKDQWMFGPSLMACPVGYYQKRSREVYLPRQRGWYDLYTGRHYAGGQTVVADAPLERMPVFVPEGAILPLGPAMEWSDERTADTINLYVYTGHDACFSLYEDEGTNYNYESGKYANIMIKWDESRQQLTFCQREGAFSGMLERRFFNVIFVDPRRPQPLVLDHPKGFGVAYSGREVVVRRIKNGIMRLD